MMRTSEKKKILVVSHVPTHPQNAGNKRRIFENVELLKEIGYEVDFLYYRSGLNDDIKLMRQYFGNQNFHVVVPTEMSYVQKIKKGIRDVLRATRLDRKIVLHYNIDERYDPVISKAAVKLYNKKKYGTLMVEYVMYSKVLENFDSSVVKIIDTHDKFSYRERLFMEKRESPSFFYTTPKGERKGLSRADIVVAIQDKEKYFFSKLLQGTRTKVCTLGQRIEAVQMPLTDKPVIGFIGSDNVLNQQALQWFIEEVFPQVKKRMPDVEFKIAGSICGCVSKSKLYERLGIVDQVETFYAGVRVVVNPVRSGTGLNIKSIEAIAYAKPMVTTKVGAKGLDSSKNIFFVSDDKDTFANMVCELLMHDDQCEFLMNNCRRFVKSYNQNVLNVMNQIFN